MPRPVEHGGFVATDACGHHEQINVRVQRVVQQLFGVYTVDALLAPQFALRVVEGVVCGNVVVVVSMLTKVSAVLLGQA